MEITRHPRQGGVDEGGVQVLDEKVAATIKGKQLACDLADSADMKSLGKMAGPLANSFNAGIFKSR